MASSSVPQFTVQAQVKKIGLNSTEFDATLGRPANLGLSNRVDTHGERAKVLNLNGHSVELKA